MKTASTELKSKNGVPTNPNAVSHPVSQPGPEDGRDQNITPNPASYDPAVSPSQKGNVDSRQGENHNEEVYRPGEEDPNRPTY
jgi:hypothetical protein